MVPKPSKLACRSLGLLVASLIVGCSSKPDVPPMAGGSLLSPSASDSNAPLGSCTENGATRACSKTLSQHGTVLSCYYGTQTCVSGVWSDCQDGTIVTQTARVSTGNGERLASISASQPCGDNPCDPTCQRYIEVPSTGLIAQASSTTWQLGAISGFSTTIQNLISTPNCETAADCQQNQHCVNVATDSTCAHDKCQAGQSLSASCSDACVSNICATNPSCCDTLPHCDPGQLLGPDGTRCYYFNTNLLPRDSARSDCAALGTQWDLTCVSTAAEETFIRSNTSADAWQGLERINYDDPNSAFRCLNGEQPLSNGLIRGQWPWNGGEPNFFTNSENCAEIYGLSGLWNDMDCDWEGPSWCEGPVKVPNGWTSTCANLVANVCGATCDTTGSNAPATCQAWAQGETNPNAQGPDLAIGVPCEGQIPVCNHGTAVAPAGAVVHVLPTNNTFGVANVAAQLGTCTTATTIAPGACAMVAGCSSLLTANAELWVSYPTGVASEVRTDDNWGYSVPGVVCGPPQCLPGLGPCFTSVTKTFDYQGNCPQSDQVPQWSYLTFEASTPGDSSIAFSVAAAPSSVQLSTAPMTPLATVSQAAGNEQCELSGPVSKNCPVDLYKALTPQATTHGSVLRLTVTLNPSSDGAQSPVLSGWKISYSCPAGT